MGTTTELSRFHKSSFYPISKEAIQSIAANMREHGFDPDFPILVKDGAIVDGYHRYEAAQVGRRGASLPRIRRQMDAIRLVLRATATGGIC